MQDLKEVLSNNQDFLVLGGGSNLLLLHDIQKPVLHINIKGKEIIHETEEAVWVKVKAGENWHEFVLWTLESSYGGIENLALIPGNVGTTPMQNIGAYGVEVKDVIEKVYAIEIATQKESVFANTECEFDYRESIFKKSLKGQYIITAVSFKLTKNKHHIQDSYGAIQQVLSDQSITNPGINDIADAVIHIRQSKMPDPKEIGNSGSFFKNPVVDKIQFERLLEKYPDIPNYPVPKNKKKVKLAAGWLIDRCGLKGYREGAAGVHEKQALVLVNYGKATGKEILILSQKVQKKVFDKFGVQLQPEVNIID